MTRSPSPCVGERAHDQPEAEHEPEQRQVDGARHVARARAPSRRHQQRARGGRPRGVEPSGPAATKPGERQREHRQRARRERRGSGLGGVRPGRLEVAAEDPRSAPHSIAIATAHGSAISAAKRANESSLARNASRFVRFEIGSSSDAEFARCAHAYTCGRPAQARLGGGGERGGREQHDGRVEAEHRGHRGGRAERRASAAAARTRARPPPAARRARRTAPPSRSRRRARAATRARRASARGRPPRRSRRSTRARRPRAAAARRRARPPPPARAGRARPRRRSRRRARAPRITRVRRPRRHSAAPTLTTAPRGAPSRPTRASGPATGSEPVKVPKGCS